MIQKTRLGAARWLSELLSRQEVRFLIVGGTNTALGLTVFALLEWGFGETVPYLGSLALSYAISIGVAFTLQRRFVFQVRGNVLVDLIRFTSVQASAFALNALLLPFLVEVCRLPVLLAQVFALALVVVGSYFGHLLFSFRRPPH